LIFEQNKCFGCGVCLSTCPTNSISLINRTDVRRQNR
jgi:NAD-dependent dihydropyrimidine dehydrogenase PreA subunit